METLKNYRIKYNYSCQDMANILNISKSFYWQVENGKRKLSYETACKISKIFETTPDILFYNDYKSLTTKKN